MPLKKDPQGGGTEADGTKSRMYCSLCYRQGAFVDPDRTVQGMQALVKSKLKEMGLPGVIAGFMALGIPKLERWKKT